ncbi:MAG: hypothetical protein A2Y06_03245 [Omnitrophica WOR_2 bacterium GWA2_37_7]|nr:MAG: hypothetical protein A2Y06_03245 [Omnitrophica WOR_2 bacterium GWA2_37_7]HBG64403.1 hypothetical protein [Candidatus Omnitrophota bacterium]
MENILQRLGISVLQLQCIDKVFRKQSSLYSVIESKMKGTLGESLKDISKELYAGGKTSGNAVLKLNRQMILGDVIEYIFTGRAYYYAVESKKHFGNFSKLILYCVNQLLLLDTITIYPKLRKKYIESLEKIIGKDILYEKEGDEELAAELKKSNIVIWEKDWEKFDAFVDSLLPKTLGCPKELIVFTELIRLNIGLVIPMLLLQRLFGDGHAIAPPDFLILKKNKEIFGIEVGYNKEGQSREFSLRTSIPTFAVDLSDHMHNRCPKCGENILYCDIIIEKYANGTLWESLNKEGRYICFECPEFDNEQCVFSNYYGRYEGPCFYGKQKEGDGKKYLHYHAKCVLNEKYKYRREYKKIKETHKQEFFAQYPMIEGIENITK